MSFFESLVGNGAAAAGGIIGTQMQNTAEIEKAQQIAKFNHDLELQRMQTAKELELEYGQKNRAAVRQDLVTNADTDNALTAGRTKSEALAKLDPSITAAQAAANTTLATATANSEISTNLLKASNPQYLDSIEKIAKANPEIAGKLKLYEAQAKASNAAAGASSAQAAKTNQETKLAGIMLEAQQSLIKAANSGDEAAQQAAAQTLSILKTGTLDKLGDAAKSQIADVNKQLEGLQAAQLKAAETQPMVDENGQPTQIGKFYESKRQELAIKQNQIYANAGLLDKNIQPDVQRVVKLATASNDPAKVLDDYAADQATKYGGKYAEKVKAAVEDAKKNLPAQSASPADSSSGASHTGAGVVARNVNSPRNGTPTAPEKVNEVGYVSVESTIAGALRGDAKAKDFLPQLVARGETTPDQRRRINEILSASK